MSHGGGSSDRWLVSYSDFITLLMVLFVVLYSMGQTDVKKYKALAESFKVAFSGGSAAKVVDPEIDRTGGLSETAKASPIEVEGLPMVSAVGQEVAGQLTDMLNQSNLSSEVSIQNNMEGVLISLSEKLIFVQGTAELQPEAYPVLDTIINMVTPLTNDVKIVGHTDNSQPIDPKYSNNWELSFGRAYTIGKYFEEHGIASSRLIYCGRGEYQPIFPNDTEMHRALNSRAEIVIVYPIQSDVINVDMSQIQQSPAIDEGSTTP